MHSRAIQFEILNMFLVQTRDFLHEKKNCKMSFMPSSCPGQTAALFCAPRFGVQVLSPRWTDAGRLRTKDENGRCDSFLVMCKNRVWW